MRSERRKKSMENGLKKAQEDSNSCTLLIRYKFNISMDNLKPFMIENTSARTIKK